MALFFMSLSYQYAKYIFTFTFRLQLKSARTFFLTRDIVHLNLCGDKAKMKLFLEIFTFIFILWSIQQGCECVSLIIIGWSPQYHNN